MKSVSLNLKCELYSPEEFFDYVSSPTMGLVNAFYNPSCTVETATAGVINECLLRGHRQYFRSPYNRDEIIEVYRNKETRWPREQFIGSEVLPEDRVYIIINK